MTTWAQIRREVRQKQRAQRIRRAGSNILWVVFSVAIVVGFSALVAKMLFDLIVT